MKINAFRVLVVCAFVFFAAATFFIIQSSILHSLNANSIGLFVVGLCAGLLCITYAFHIRNEFFSAQTSMQTKELAQSRDYLMRANEHLIALHSFSNSITNCFTIADVCTTATDALVKNFSYDTSIFWIWDKKSQHLICISANTFSSENSIVTPDSLAIATTLLETMIQSQKTFMIRGKTDANNKQSPNEAALLKHLQLFSLAASPLIHDNELLGVLLAGYHAIQSMDTHDAHVLEALISSSGDRMAKGQLEYLDEKEQMIFNSVSNLSGDALIRVVMFSGMEEEIEKRATELKKTHEKLIETREILVQVEKLSSLGRMAAGVIHEINDPLNFLVNILPDVKRDFEGLAKVKDFLVTQCKDSAQSIAIQKIITDYELDSHLEELDFIFTRAADALGKSSRIAQGLHVFASGEKSESRRTNLQDLVKQTLELIPPKIKGSVIISVDTSSEIVWDVNPDRFSQVCMNLIMNALDAMGGKGEISMSGNSTHEMALIRFSDTGPGIAPEIQKKIFEPFFTTKPAGKSTGLGLTICAEIVRDFGGRFEIESALGKGTTFTIVFTKEQKIAFSNITSG